MLKKIISSVVASVLVASSAVLATVPAQAADFSPGRAVARIDAPSVTTTKTGENTYRMELKKGAAGQWMGERTMKNGKVRTLVGDLTAENLVKHWKDLKYTKSGATGTLTWGDAENPQARAIRLEQPIISNNRVILNISTPASIPSTLRNVSVNLLMAPMGQNRSVAMDYTDQPPSTTPTTKNFTISGDLTASIELVSVQDLKFRIFNAGDNSTCWGTTEVSANLSQKSGYPVYESVGSKTCAGVPYANANTKNSPYGALVQWPGYCTTPGDDSGTASFYLIITPSGQSSFKFNHGINWFC